VPVAHRWKIVLVAHRRLVLVDDGDTKSIYGIGRTDIIQAAISNEKASQGVRVHPNHTNDGEWKMDAPEKTES